MQFTTRFAIAILGAGAAFGLYRRRKKRDLRGQTALITGSSRGLGFLLAREYARQGCRVVICARDSQGIRTIGSTRTTPREVGLARALTP